MAVFIVGTVENDKTEIDGINYTHKSITNCLCQIVSSPVINDASGANRTETKIDDQTIQFNWTFIIFNHHTSVVQRVILMQMMLWMWNSTRNSISFVVLAKSTLTTFLFPYSFFNEHSLVESLGLNFQCEKLQYFILFEIGFLV